MSSNIVTAYYGAVINPEDLRSYSLWPRALIAVEANGDIAWIEKDVQPVDVRQFLKDGIKLVELSNSEFLLPGFIDTHTVSKHDIFTSPTSLRRTCYSMRLKYRTWEGLYPFHHSNSMLNND